MKRPKSFSERTLLKNSSCVQTGFLCSYLCIFLYIVDAVVCTDCIPLPRIFDERKVTWNGKRVSGKAMDAGLLTEKWMRRRPCCKGRGVTQTIALLEDIRTEEHLDSDRYPSYKNVFQDPIWKLTSPNKTRKKGPTLIRATFWFLHDACMTVF